MESLYVDVDRRTWREYMRFAVQSEALGMKSSRLWDEDYGPI